MSIQERPLSLGQKIRDYFTLTINEDGEMLVPNGFKWFLLRWKDNKRNCIKCYLAKLLFYEKIKWWLLKKMLSRKTISLFVSLDALKKIYGEDNNVL